MSIKVMTAVWDRSGHKGSALLLLLAIADHAHDDGAGAYPSVPALAQKTRMSGRQVQRLLETLERSGELAVEWGAGPRGTHRYRVVLDALGRQDVAPDKMSPPTNGHAGGDILSGRGDIAMSPEPSFNRQEPSDGPAGPEHMYSARLNQLVRRSGLEPGDFGALCYQAQQEAGEDVSRFWVVLERLADEARRRR